jgi:serine/threonine protein kinase
MIGQLLTGRYLILKKLGAGGFSETYLARDKYLPHHPLCVVKCFRLLPDSTISVETARRLFETEARILDQLGRNHVQIPTLFAYCHEQDQVYQVQEYVEGENLGGWLVQGRQITSEAAIELLSQVLPILNYLHSHHVVHRDIKPNHLIYRPRDQKVVLIDFGAACLLSGNESSLKSQSDESLLMIGTPGYMPIEQQTGDSRLNSDLYALGISVIQLLTGVDPQQFTQDPISGELDWQTYLSQPIDAQLIPVLNRMVRVRARDRYTKAEDVLAALRAVPNSKLSARRWYISNQRRSIPQLLKPAAAILLVAGMIGTGWYGLEQGGYAAGMLAQLNLIPHRAETHLTLLRSLPMQSAIQRMMIAPNNRVLITASADHVLRLWSLPAGSLIHSLSGHTSSVTAIAMNRNSDLLISGSEDRSVRLWNTQTGTLIRTFTGHKEAITAVALSPDARSVISGSKDGTIRIWDMETGNLQQTIALPKGDVTAVAYAPDSRSLISASSDRQLQLWDLPTGELRRTFAGHTAPIIGLQVLDNRTLLSLGQDRALMWDLDREELVQVCSDDSAKPVTASLNDREIITVHDNGKIKVWTRKAGQLVATISGLGQNLDVALSPNHHYLVSWSPDQPLQVWQMDAKSLP